MTKDFFLQIFWILLMLCLLWYEQMLDSYAAVFKGNCKALCPSIIINFYNCMQYCTKKLKNWLNIFTILQAFGTVHVLSKHYFID